jgi:hypothetical protein
MGVKQLHSHDQEEKSFVTLGFLLFQGSRRQQPITRKVINIIVGSPGGMTGFRILAKHLPVYSETHDPGPECSRELEYDRSTSFTTSPTGRSYTIGIFNRAPFGS